jgi:hypothetical protein
MPVSIRVYVAETNLVWGVYPDDQIPVYEAMIRGISVMRRTSDSWVNATQILKVAGIPKSARTKILDKEVAAGVHEKVQGGCECIFLVTSREAS